MKRENSKPNVFFPPDMKRLLGKLFSDDAVKRLNKQFTISSVQQRDGSLIPVVHVKSRGQSLELRPHEICAKVRVRDWPYRQYLLPGPSKGLPEPSRGLPGSSKGLPWPSKGLPGPS